ncbi:MAG: TonB-dependent receptor, partial [Cyanobacteria bacterium J06559_3]
VQREDSFRDFDQAIERDFIAPVVAWDISDHTTLALDLEYFRDERPIDSGLLAFGDGVVDVPRDRIAGEPDDVAERDFYSIGYRFEHEFSDNWSLRNAFRYSNQDYNSTAFVPVFFDEVSGDVTRFDSTTRWDQEYYGLQTDIVGRFETGSIGHTVLFGVDFSWNRSDIESRIDLAAPSILNIFDPIYGTSARRSFEELPNPARVQVVTTSRLGIFLQDQIDLSENLKFLAGIRYDTVSQDVDNDVSGFDPTGREVDQTVDAFTPRLGIVYQPIPELALYASYSQSFTPSSASDIAGDLLEPEEGEGFEIGLKTELFDQRLIATLAYFDITKQNVATLDPDAPAFANASIATGEQRSQGIELDLTAEILPGWNLIANYAYTDARVTEDNAIPTGNGLTGIPEHSASLWTTYTLQQGNLAGLGFGLGFNYVGDRPGDLDNSFELDDYLITHAAIFYERDNLQLALNFKNLFDVNYIDGIPISRVRGIEPGEPFTIIGSVSFQF